MAQVKLQIIFNLFLKYKREWKCSPSQDGPPPSCGALGSVAEKALMTLISLLSSA
jgi:hypothetical protein